MNQLRELDVLGLDPSPYQRTVTLHQGGDVPQEAPSGSGTTDSPRQALPTNGTTEEAGRS